MGLTYFFELCAGEDYSVEDLRAFLENVRTVALELQFSSVELLDVQFDTRERQHFSTRLGIPYYAEDERLKGLSLPSEDQVTRHNSENGRCLVFPERGLVVALADSAGDEVSFGFLKYPKTIKDAFGKAIAEPPFGGKWCFHNCLKTPDRRYRTIVRLFQEAGFVLDVVDDFYD